MTIYFPLVSFFVVIVKWKENFQITEIKYAESKTVL